MQSKVRIGGHAVHPMLVDFPIVAFPFLVGFDLLWKLTSNEAFWIVGGWVAVAGGAVALLAIVTGTIDLAAIPNAHRAHGVALWHFALGCIIFGLYLVVVLLRWPLSSSPHHTTVAIVLDVVGMVLVFGQGYLGGELMERHHIGIPTVEQGADPVTLK